MESQFLIDKEKVLIRFPYDDKTADELFGKMKDDIEISRNDIWNCLMKMASLQSFDQLEIKLRGNKNRYLLGDKSVHCEKDMMNKIKKLQAYRNSFIHFLPQKELIKDNELDGIILKGFEYVLIIMENRSNHFNDPKYREIKGKILEIIGKIRPTIAST